MLTSLLIISSVINACAFYQIRQPKSSKANLENKNNDRNDSKDIYENPDEVQDDIYDQVEDDQSTYTTPRWTGNEYNDNLYVNQADTRAGFGLKLVK